MAIFADYTTNAIFVDDMGSVPAMHVTTSPHETKEEQYLWHLNRMREHDNLPPLKKVPSSVVFTPKVY